MIFGYQLQKNWVGTLPSGSVITLKKKKVLPTIMMVSVSEREGGRGEIERKREREREKEIVCVCERE